MDIQKLFTEDLQYLLIFSAVLLLPKILIRYKVPSGITALLLGLILSPLFPYLKTDHLFRFLSQIGITSLFLFAGLEVDFEELKEDRVYLGKYLVKFSLGLLIVNLAIFYFFDLGLRTSFILSLGIFTPSAGFIMNSLHSYGVEEDQEYWVKSKAISKEILSVILLFFALSGDKPLSLITSLAFYIGLFLILPKIFKFFFKNISPYTPNSEIPFLIMLSLVAGVISKELGSYYIVGAFVVGLVGSRFKNEFFHEGEETLFRALASFFTVFLPFYFFYTGLGFSLSGLSLKAIGVGVLMIVLCLPLRIFLINNSLRRFLPNEEFDYYRISLSLMPTLVFGLVITNILITHNLASDTVAYGLIVYTLITSSLPALIFHLWDKRKYQKNQ